MKITLFGILKPRDSCWRKTSDLFNSMDRVKTSNLPYVNKCVGLLCFLSKNEKP